MFRRALTLGHVATIPIRIHWSWLIVFALLIGALGPIYTQYTSAPGAWGLAALMGLLICGSVLLHELSHALVAQRYAVTVRSITLFALGGAAEVQDESPSPGSEFAIAVAGPAISLLVALTCGLLSWGAGIIHTPYYRITSVLALHLGLANAIMAVFNLLPGYPMDGGRILRATLWFLADDVLSATRIAAYVGQVCGALLGVAGVALAIVTAQPFVALWMSLIGFFLYRTAVNSYSHLVTHMTLTGVRVADLMQRSCRTVSPEITLEQFVARYVLGQSDQGFPVVSAALTSNPDTSSPELSQPPVLLGMMTLRNLRRFTMREWPFTRVGEAMTPMHYVRVVSPSWNAFDALSLMREMQVDLLPVTDGPHFVGILRRRDLAIYVQMNMKK